MKTRENNFKGKLFRAKKLKTKEQCKYKLFTTGTMPSLTYGHEITGWTPASLRSVRIKAAKALGLWKPGCSLDLV